MAITSREAVTDRSPPTRAHSLTLCKYTECMPQYDTPTGEICKAVLITALSLIDKRTSFINILSSLCSMMLLGSVFVRSYVTKGNKERGSA